MPGGRDPPAGERGDLGAVALLDRDVGSRGDAGVEGRERRGDVERHAVPRARAPPRCRCRSCSPRRRCRRCGRRPPRRRSTIPRDIRAPTLGRSTRRCGMPSAAELPGGQSRALEQRPRLVHPDRSTFPASARRADHAEGGAVAAGGERPGVAVGEDPLAARRRAPLRRGPSPRRRRGRPARWPAPRRAAPAARSPSAVRASDRALALERPAQVDRRRARGVEHRNRRRGGGPPPGSRRRAPRRRPRRCRSPARRAPPAGGWLRRAPARSRSRASAPRAAAASGRAAAAGRPASAAAPLRRGLASRSWSRFYGHAASIGGVPAARAAERGEACDFASRSGSRVRSWCRRAGSSRLRRRRRRRRRSCRGCRRSTRGSAARRT